MDRFNHHSYLTFDAGIGGKKPETIVHQAASCPFCNRSELKDIIAEDGAILMVKNKYPVLRDTLQTVIIETEECHSELSLYSQDHLHRLIDFGVTKWQEMMDTREFTSVIFYKNHGPYSGGTIRHPHMQIVGLKYINYLSNIRPSSFEGSIIAETTGVQLNLSTEPHIGFCEFNIKLAEPSQLHKMADYIQIVVKYLLNQFHRNCTSYNLFFYQLGGEIIVKILPRFVTSPLFVGYAIPQVTSRAEEVIEEMRQFYFHV